MYTVTFSILKKKATIEVAYNHSRKNGGSLIHCEDITIFPNDKISLEYLRVSRFAHLPMPVFLPTFAPDWMHPAMRPDSFAAVILNS